MLIYADLCSFSHEGYLDSNKDPLAKMLYVIIEGFLLTENVRTLQFFLYSNKITEISHVIPFLVPKYWIR